MSPLVHWPAVRPSDPAPKPGHFSVRPHNRGMMKRAEQTYADATIEAHIRAFRKKGKHLDTDLAILHRILKKHYVHMKLTTKQAQARASWDVEQTRRAMTHTA